MNSSFSVPKKSSIRLLGIVIYYIFLILTVWLIVIFRLYWGILNPIDLFRIFLIFFLCTIPAAPSSFIVSYLNQDRYEGFRTLFLVGLILGAVCLIFFCFFLLPIFFYPPRGQYESLVRAGIIVAITLFTLFFFLPLVIFSGVFSAIFGNLGYILSLNRKSSFSLKE